MLSDRLGEVFDCMIVRPARVAVKPIVVEVGGGLDQPGRSE